MAVNLERQAEIQAKKRRNAALRSKYPVWIITSEQATKLGREVLKMAIQPVPQDNLKQAEWRHDISTTAAYALEHGDLGQFDMADISRLRTMASEYTTTAQTYLPVKMANPEFVGAMNLILRRLVGPQKSLETHL